jgi:YD repeat-containing protein
MLRRFNLGPPAKGRAGNLYTKTDPNGNTTTYDYDYDNRLITKTYQDSSTRFGGHHTEYEP